MLFIIILALAFLITKPYLSALLTGAIIAYLSYPLYRKTLVYIKNKNLASLIVSVAIVLLITVPLIVVFSIVFKEASVVYNNLGNQTLAANFMQIACKNPEWMLCTNIKSVVSQLPKGNADYYMQIVIGKITNFIIDNAKKLLSSIPSIMLNFFIMMFVVYYLLKDGEMVARRIKGILPLKESHKKQVMQKFHNVTFEVFYSNLFVAALQGLLGTIGFMILGIPSPILWGAVMTLFALIPYFGTAIIWLPAALNLLFLGYLQDNTSFTVKGIILILYGVLVISTIDNLVKPKLIGKRADVHPVLVLLGVLGGLSLFGIIGLVLGPVMLALLVTFIDIYQKEKEELEKSSGG